MNSPKGAIFFFVVGCLCLLVVLMDSWMWRIAESQRDKTFFEKTFGSSSTQGVSDTQAVCVAAGVVCWAIAVLCIQINGFELEAQRDLAFFFAQGYVDPCTATVADFMGDPMVCERKRQREHQRLMEQQRQSAAAAQIAAAVSRQQQRQSAAAAQIDRDMKHQQTMDSLRHQKTVNSRGARGDQAWPQTSNAPADDDDPPMALPVGEDVDEFAAAGI
jgi:hypothetical protein